MSKSEGPKKIFVPEKDKVINVEKAIAEKNPRLLKVLPNFMLNFIKKTIREDEINSVIYRNKDKHGIDFIDAGFAEMEVTISYNGLENIPKTGGVFLAANHPLGGMDGAAFIKTVGEVRKDIKVFVNDVLMQMKNIGEFLVPVNSFGKNDESNYKQFEDIYKSEEALLIFPAGMVSRRQERKQILDLRWKRSIIEKAVEYQKKIIPVYIHALNSKRFYNLGYYRKKLGIKTNLEMFYLPDEMFKLKGQTIHFEIGKPIPSTYWDDSKKPEEWVQWLKDKVYSMAPDLSDKS